jgi:hypothetical protein
MSVPEALEVTFTKATGRRYYMRVARQSGPPLAPRQGPGYHDYLPHDAVHFIVEAEAGLAGAVSGGSRAARRTSSPSPIRHSSDGSAAERLAARTLPPITKIWRERKCWCQRVKPRGSFGRGS